VAINTTVKYLLVCLWYVFTFKYELKALASEYRCLKCLNNIGQMKLISRFVPRRFMLEDQKISSLRCCQIKWQSAYYTGFWY